MNIKKEKTYDPIVDLIGKVDHETFTTAQVLRDIVDAVQPMHKLATSRVQADGVFAKLFADQVADRLGKIFLLANDRLSDIVDVNTNQS